MNEGFNWATAEVPNKALRDHVLGNWTLVLGKTHISMLIAVGNNSQALFPRDWVSPGHGLRRRGLLMHALDRFGRQPSADGYGRPNNYWGRAHGKNLHDGWDTNTLYRLTRAGWAVYDLLVESGLAKPVPLKKRKYAEAEQ